MCNLRTVCNHIALSLSLCVFPSIGPRFASRLCLLGTAESIMAAARNLSLRIRPRVIPQRICMARRCTRATVRARDTSTSRAPGRTVDPVWDLSKFQRGTRGTRKSLLYCYFSCCLSMLLSVLNTKTKPHSLTHTHPHETQLSSPQI